MPADIIFFHQQIIVTEDVIVLDYAILQDHWRINNCTRKIHNVWIIVLKFLENADILHSFHHTGSSKITQSVYFNRNINFSEIEILDNVAYSPKRIERKTVQNLRSIKCVMQLLKITTDLFLQIMFSMNPILMKCCFYESKALNLFYFSNT